MTEWLIPNAIVLCRNEPLIPFRLLFLSGDEGPEEFSIDSEFCGWILLILLPSCNYSFYLECRDLFYLMCCDDPIFSRVHATLQPALSVCRSVGRYVLVSFFGVTGGFCITAPAQTLG